MAYLYRHRSTCFITLNGITPAKTHHFQHVQPTKSALVTMSQRFLPGSIIQISPSFTMYFTIYSSYIHRLATFGNMLQHCKTVGSVIIRGCLRFKISSIHSIYHGFHHHLPCINSPIHHIYHHMIITIESLSPIISHIAY